MMCSHLGPPWISIHPVNQLVGFNTSVIVRCKGSGIKPLIHYWETRSNIVQPWLIAAYPSIEKLVLKDVQSTRQARCMVINTCGVALSRPATITVFSKSYNWLLSGAHRARSMREHVTPTTNCVAKWQNSNMAV